MRPALLKYALLLAAILAFLLRVVPCYEIVFRPSGVAFQENDAWFHVRTVHNLLAHFPWRSGFDPYAVYPGGANVPTGPLFDYWIAFTAWIIGLGSPTFLTVERVAAWLPAVIGALFPIAVFQLTRRLFDDLAALCAAFWIALLPGVFLWMSHLGLADHHAAESLFAFLTLAFLCAAVESSGRRAWLWTIAAGISMGAYLATRPAGIFIAGIVTLAALLQPATARVSAVVLAIGAVLFAPVSGVQWSNETWLALAVGIAITSAAAAADALGRRYLAIVATAAVGLAAYAIHPSSFAVVLFQWKRVRGMEAGPYANTVSEMLPLLQSLPGSRMNNLFQQLGYAWILALPALLVVTRLMGRTTAGRTRRPALMLFAIWTWIMAAGAFAQVRMAVYFAVHAAILAGVACAWIIRVGQTKKTQLAGAGIVVLLIGANIPLSLRQMNINASPTQGWEDALQWLRRQTPEPMGDAASWTHYYPALASGSQFQYPRDAYSVAVWWDYGYWVEYLARRIPASNGTQTGATSTANFYVSTDPESALRALDGMGSRYVMTDPSLQFFDLSGSSRFPAIVEWAGQSPERYYRVFYDHGRFRIVYLPDYYRAMAVRLFLSDGGATEARGRPWVIHTRLRQTTQGSYRDMDWKSEFANLREAENFVARKPQHDYVVGGFDPAVSYVDVAATPGLRLVYTSDALPISPDRPVRAVKVFERVR